MTTPDIKATVAELERIYGNAARGNRASAVMFSAVVHETWPLILNELKRLWEASAKLIEQQNEIARLRSIKEAAESLRDVFGPFLTIYTQDTIERLFAAIDAKPRS